MVQPEKKRRIELRKKVKSLKLNSYIFFGIAIPLTIILSPYIFHNILFPEAALGEEPDGYFFFPLLVLISILPVRFFVSIGHYYYKITDEAKFDRLDRDVAYYEHQSKKTWLNYLMFPIGTIFGFLYGNIVAITTTGITFMEGGWKVGVLALVFNILIFALVQLEVITLWIFDILMLLFSEITIGEADGYIPPDHDTNLLIDHYDSDGWEKNSKTESNKDEVE